MYINIYKHNSFPLSDVGWGSLTRGNGKTYQRKSKQSQEFVTYSYAIESSVRAPVFIFILALEYSYKRRTYQLECKQNI